MSDAYPLVSAIIPTKDRVDLLQRALQSVFTQTYQNIEVIVVNDSSTDDTEERLDEWKNQSPFNLKVITNRSSVGAAQARNQAIEAANGTFIAGLDDDDIWHERRIERLLDAYSDNFSCITSDVWMRYSKREIRWKKQKVIDMDTLLFSNQVGNQALIKRERLLAIGGFDTKLQAAQDYDLWVRLCETYGPIYNVQQPLQTVYADHEGAQITNQSSFSGYLQFYKKHKHRMSGTQRKYQLYNIRRAQNKPEQLRELITMVPPHRYVKEVKRLIANWVF